MQVVRIQLEFVDVDIIDMQLITPQRAQLKFKVKLSYERMAKGDLTELDDIRVERRELCCGNRDF